MAENNQRCAPINSTQKQLLLEYLKNHPKLQSGNFSPAFTKNKAAELWQEITNTLNSIPNGAIKEWKQWRKTWQDQKKNVKSKLCKHRRSATQTGGGPADPATFTTIENEILSLIKPATIDGDVAIGESEVTIDVVQAEVSGIFPNETVQEIEPPASVAEIPSQISMVSGSTPSTSDSGARSKAASTKAKRLSKCIDVGAQLAAGSERKNTVLENYYERKLKGMKLERLRRDKYEKRKIELLREQNMVFHNILQELQNLSGKFGHK